MRKRAEQTMSNVLHQQEQTGSAKMYTVLVTLGVFMTLTLILILIDFVPEPRTEEPDVATSVIVGTTSASRANVAPDDSQTTGSTWPGLQTSATPARIVIDRIGVDTQVLNPESTDVEVLDRALLSGAVRYPGSGGIGETANMLIFGHSSNLPVIRNQAFRAFNQLGTLQQGDIVTVYSNTHKYEYTVRDVRLADAEEVVIYFDASEPTLTLATCNTFGAKQERWVVTALLTQTTVL
jgi:LPXTG-site transpeptidase (sortase) family protein